VVPLKKRETYRYTPLLAWALLPNIYWSMVCGKVLFIVADILCAFLQHHILVLRGTDRQTAWRWVAALWLFNPFVVTITTRGSAEALVALLVLGTLAAVYSRRLVAAGVLFGLAVQFKAYAILYALPIYFYLNADYTGRDRVAGQGTWVGHVRLFFNPSRLSFTFVSAGTFLALSGLMYWMYVWTSARAAAVSRRRGLTRATAARCVGSPLRRAGTAGSSSTRRSCTT